MKPILLAIGAWLVLAQAVAGQTADRSAALNSVDRIYAAEAAAHPIGSMTVGVVDHGRLIWVKSYGFADMEKRIPASRATVYRIGSITKQFTGLALLQLAAQGRVKLDDPAVTYVPELKTSPGFASAGSPITLLSLATHRAGLAREPDGARFLTGPIDQWQAITREALAHTRIAFPVNDVARYSNIGYATLGLALEKASGTSYTDLVEDRILRPLGMTSSAFRPNADMLARLAKGYARTGDPKLAADELANGRGYKIPNGGLFTTVDDLARFVAFEMGYGPETVLSHATVLDNYRRTFSLDGGGRYGVGFMVQELDDHILIGHDGGVAGYLSSALIDPDSQIAVICLRSADVPCDGPFLIEALAALMPSWANQARRMREAQAYVAKRFAAQQPLPKGGETLRRVIGELQRGAPDYTRLSVQMAAVIHEQAGFLHDELSKLGEVQAVGFHGVGSGGADIYQVEFAHGKQEWRISLAEDHKVDGLNVRPLP
jgi:CubicO group peptidase (beta-lactamase class C family)